MRISKGKDCVTILDHVGMYQAFGFPTEDWNWQLMFTGELAGKAGIGREQLLYIRDTDSKEKELLNLKMVPVKRKEEEHRGLEIFMKDGLYGIAKDGRMIHQPLFEHIRKADDGYFAYCTYPYKVYSNRVTIIDKDGCDLKLRMYGNLEWKDKNILKGVDINGEPLYWDKAYNTYYHEEPKFERVGGIEMVKLSAGYVLRKYPNLLKPTKKQKIYFNHKIVWMRDWLMIKYGPSSEGGYGPLRILAYGLNHFYVESEDQDLPRVTILDTIGNFIDRRWTVPSEDYHRFPIWRYTLLTNAYTGKEGFLEE